MTNISWIKITTDIFNDEKVLLIESIAPEHDAVIVIWFKLLTLAGRTNNNGVFMINDKLAYTPEMLATIFRRPLKTVKLALEIFESLGMVEIINDVITIPNWEKHQNTEALDKTREKTRQRVAAFREKQKRLANTESYQNDIDVTTGVTLPVTLRNDIEEREEKKEEKNRLEVDGEEKREEFKSPSQKTESNFSVSDCVQTECLDEHQKTYKELHRRWVNAGLPLSAGSATDYFKFSCRELKSSMGMWIGQALAPDEILEAVENYIKLAELIRLGQSWMTTVGGFDFFAKNILQYLDGCFDLDKYKKKMQEQKVFDKEEEIKKVEALMAEMGIVENH